MAQYIDKSALVAWIKRRMDENRGKQTLPQYFGMIEEDLNILSFIDTLEVKEVGIFIPNIDDLFEEDGIDPNSKEAKIFKESYYMALERLKEKKGEEV